MTEVQFSSELFMAPEMMYCSLELPSMVEECTKELPDHILKECFSNILITGMYADIISLKSFLLDFFQANFLNSGSSPDDLIHVLESLDAVDLVRPKLVDSFLEYSTNKQESYV